jgi:SAM-dependent methyltransferase
MRFGAGIGASAKPSAKDLSAARTRHSSGFDQFCAFLHVVENLSILDLSGASQANISFITGYGHRISSDDIVGAMHECFGNDFIQTQQAASNAQRFLDQALTFPDALFDGVLAWDALQFLTPPLIEQVVAQLLRIMRPGGLMLAFFNAHEKAVRIPVYNYRIQDQKTLLQIPRGIVYQRSQYFTYRALEKLFEGAASLKFFLTRDHLREVIVRR